MGLCAHTPERIHYTSAPSNMAKPKSTHGLLIVITFGILVSATNALDLGGKFFELFDNPIDALGKFLEHPQENARSIVEAGEESYRSFMAEPEQGVETLFEVGNDFMATPRFVNLDFTNFTNSITVDQLAQLFAGGLLVLLIAFLVIELLAQNKEAGTGFDRIYDNSDYGYTDRYGNSHSYDHLYSVSRALYNGYKAYEEDKYS